MLNIEPHAGPAPIVRVINDARHTVDLNVYYLSSRQILDALRSATSRGVRVRVILDEKPDGMSGWKVRKEYAQAKATGAQVRWAPSRFEHIGNRWAFDHAKYVCNGQECEIGTANYDWSAFHRNREYLEVTRNPHVVQAAQAVFSADWNNRRAPSWAHQVLVLSPGTSQAQLIQVIDQSGPVDIESEELGDDRAILNVMARKGRSLRLILPSSISPQDRKNAAWLVNRGVHVRLLPKRPLYLHAKMLVGNTTGFIGSENFSGPSLNDNREMGLILHGNNLIRLRQQFAVDWNHAVPLASGHNAYQSRRSSYQKWHHWEK